MGYTGIMEKRKLRFGGLGFRGGLWLQVCRLFSRLKRIARICLVIYRFAMRPNEGSPMSGFHAKKRPSSLNL